jgi:hypothetical protein
MKTLNLIAALAILITLTACKNPQRAAYNTLKGTAITVDSTMIGWSNYVAAGKATLGDRYKVRDVHDSYVASMNVALSALDYWVLATTYGTTNAPDAKAQFESYRALTLRSVADTINLINTLSK